MTHWTALLLTALCGLCALLNVVQFKHTGAVRMPGILVCAMWAVQQAFWVLNGHQDSLLLFIACDVGLWWYFRKVGCASWRDEIIEALIWPTLACGIAAHLGGMTVTIWWLNWSMVAAQMVLGLPWPVRQAGSDHYSHGSVKQGKSNEASALGAKRVGGI